MTICNGRWQRVVVSFTWTTELTEATENGGRSYVVVISVCCSENAFECLPDQPYPPHLPGIFMPWGERGS